MKHITLLTFAISASLGVHSQVIFSSGLEDWTGNAPDDFFGSKTSINADSVSQESTDPHSGSYSVHLKNSNNNHRRFTTQPLSVTAGTTYEISFWVRGDGQIRSGLFDGRTTGSGYATYNAYAIATPTWTLVTQTIAAATDTSLAEFILSVRSNTVTLVGDLYVDDVTIAEVGGTGPTPATIAAIQTTAAPDGASPLANMEVITSGIVSAVGGGGYFIQDGTGAWSGLFVNDAINIPAAGDELRITATVQENFGLTRLNALTNYEVLSTGNAIPAATPISTAQANTEPYESVLVVVNNATCTNANAGFGQWVVDDGSGAVFVDDLLFAYTPLLNAHYDVTGLLYYSFNEWKIEPRNAADIDVVTGMSSVSSNAPAAWPLPARDELFIRHDFSGPVDVTLRDADGRAVIATTMSGALLTLPVQGLAAGFYTLTVGRDTTVRSVRVAIVR